MSKFEFKLPDIGEGVTEGEIVSWLVAVGDEVAEDQEMVEVMTDKATVTIGAPQAGKIAELCGGEGDVIPVGNTLVVFDLAGGAAPAAKSEEPAPAPVESVATAVGDIKEELPGTSTARDLYCAKGFPRRTGSPWRLPQLESSPVNWASISRTYLRRALLVASRARMSRSSRPVELRLRSVAVLLLRRLRPPPLSPSALPPLPPKIDAFRSGVSASELLRIWLVRSEPRLTSPTRMRLSAPSSSLCVSERSPTLPSRASS